LYQLQLGNQIEASLNVARALELAPDYAPALLVRGRMLLGQGMFGQAAEVLAAAAQISPLPEYFWTLAEGLRANGSTEEAERIEAKLVATGTVGDPRTLALFLSSYGRDLPLALRLASEELAQRRDVFSYDALAWAQLANGQVSEARENMHRALSEGTQDARLFYHAGSIAAAAGDNGQALAFFNQAHALQALLLPSEQKSLGVRTAALVEADGLQFSSTKPNSISGQN
jgi:tetratricopeptide (TPR) repeat protein